MSSSTGRRLRACAATKPMVSSESVVLRTPVRGIRPNDGFMPQTPQKLAGRIDKPLAKGGEAGREKMGIDEDEGEDAVTVYATVAWTNNERISLMALSPLTGRTHQLRVHMAALGHPILGDGKYGAREAGQLMLHASEIAVPHPDDGTTLRVAAPLPEHFAAKLKRLGLTGEKIEQRLAVAVEKLIERGA